MRVDAARTGWASFALGALAMVATPLLPRGRRRLAASAVVAGLAGATGSAGSIRWGRKRIAVVFSTVALSTALVEKLGTSTGRPFGPYHYTGTLRPSVAGVPALVPLAWFAMALPARETAHAALGRRSSPLRRVLLGSVALTAWDLFLDPQMVAEGYWRWERPGRYREIPLTNFAGWLVTAAVLMALLEVLAPPEAEPAPALVGAYAWMAAMETLGFATFFDDHLVAAAGGAGMLPLSVLAVGRVLRGRPGG